MSAGYGYPYAWVRHAAGQIEEQRIRYRFMSAIEEVLHGGANLYLEAYIAAVQDYDLRMFRARWDRAVVTRSPLQITAGV
jgi:hypothetical protein